MLHTKAISIMIAILSVFIAIFLMAVKPNGDSEPTGYVGITEATVLGDQGLFTFNRMCHSEFPGSRFCTTEEVFKTVDPVNIVGDPAWITFIVPISPNPSLDFHGFVVGTSIQDETCGNWSSTTQSGLTLNPQSGALSKLLCNVPRPVSCCTP